MKRRFSITFLTNRKVRLKILSLIFKTAFSPRNYKNVRIFFSLNWHYLFKKLERGQINLWVSLYIWDSKYLSKTFFSLDLLTFMPVNLSCPLPTGQLLSCFPSFNSFSIRRKKGKSFRFRFVCWLSVLRD